jgi:predicted MFS family arabinose efflux permease
MAQTKSREKYIIFFAALAALMMIGHLQGGKTVRDALFLSYFDVTDLPKMMIATAVLSALAIVAFSRLLARYGPARLTPPLYIVSGIISFGEWVTMAFWPDIVTLFLYLHVTVLDSLLISGFWSIINERYDPYSAKKVISRMAIFATLGGLIGAGAASAVAKLVDVRAVIMMLAFLHLLSGLALYQVTQGQAGSKDQLAPPKGLLTILKRNTLIQRMAILMVTLAATIALLDYLFKATLQVTLSKEELVTFFAYFYIAIDIGSLLLQTFVGSKALRWFGLGGTIIVLPLGIIFGGLITFVFRSLTTITLLRGGSNLLTNSFFGPGYELLFTPISPVDKRTSKILIDVGANRSGNMLGGLMIMGLLLVRGPTSSYILFTVMLLAGVMSLLIFLLNRGYISQLASNLRSGTLKSDEIEIKDKTAQGTVAINQTRLDRDRLLQQISFSPNQVLSSEDRSENEQKTIFASKSLPVGTDEKFTIEVIRDLLSQDEHRILRVLVNKTMTPALLPHILPLLRNQGEILQEALNAIKPLVSTASGQLVDALLDYHQHPLIRRRIPLLLGQADNELALQGLTLGLQDRELDVRFRCAEALARVKTNYPHMAIDTGVIWGVVYREIAFFSRTGFKLIRGVDPLRYLFNLFGIILGPGVMDICYNALQAEDPGIRGTALEYLENQLPSNVRQPLWPLIAADRPATKSDRSTKEIMYDLLQAGRSIKSSDQILESCMKSIKELDKQTSHDPV